METLAYLQIAQDYESPEVKELVFLQDGLNFLKSFTEFKLPGNVLLLMLGVASSACILGLAGTAHALTLRPGDSGPDVSTLQQLLNDSGYSVPVTGYYGPVTESQVNSFQASTSYLAIDGIAGDATLRALGFNPISPGGSGVYQYGDSGSGVTEVQDLLRSAGYFSGASTGYYGSVTENAVYNFQRDNGLVADGVTGSSTLSALRNGGFRPVRPGTGTLQYGDQGAGVVFLQQQLSNLGFYSGAIDGYFGSGTEQALIRYQRSIGITADGIYGPQTANSLV